MSGKLERSKILKFFLENQTRRAYDRGIIMESNEKKNNYRNNNNSNSINLGKDQIVESTDMRKNLTQE